MGGRPGLVSEAVAALRSAMADLGYSPAAVHLYCSLLLRGSHTAGNARLILKMPDPQLQPAALELLKARLVFEDRKGTRDTVWYCQDPSVAWLGLSAAETWSVVSTLRALDDLPDSGVPGVEHRKGLIRRALNASLVLWRPHRPGQRNVDAPNPRILGQLVVEAVDQAQQRIRAISTSPKLRDVSEFWPVLQRRLRAGVTYTRLADVSEVYEHGLEIVQRDLSIGIELLLWRHQDLAAQRGYLSDNRILVKYDPAAGLDRPGTGAVTANPHRIARFVKRFKTFERQAVPATSVISHLAPRGAGLVTAAESLGSDAAAWLDEMVRMGKFATTPTRQGWNDEYRKEVAEKLTGAHLAVTSAQGFMLPAWAGSEETLEAVRASAGCDADVEGLAAEAATPD